MSESAYIMADEIASAERLTLRMTITQCRLTHIGQLDVALRAGVHEDIALRWMELRSSDNLC